MGDICKLILLVDISGVYNIHCNQKRGVMMDKKKGYSDHILPVFTGEAAKSLMKTFEQKSTLQPYTDEERCVTTERIQEILKNRKENTMTTRKPTDRAFVLDPKKAEEFLKQDNSNFKQIMAKFERITQQSHSIKDDK